MSLKGKIILVTGASRGIGRAIVENFLTSGATVIGTATTEQGAKAISEYIGQQGQGFVLDVTSQASVDHFFKSLPPELSNIDILVNNAGVTNDALLMRMKEEDWLKVVDTNLSSVYRMSKAVLRMMTKKRYGRIITVGSVVGSMGSPGQTSYAATKAGIIGFSKSLAIEVSARGITVNVVAPGFIATDMTDVLTDEQRAVILAKVPSARLGSPSEVADAVAFLASDGAAYITGETLHVNGGMYMN